MCRLVNPSYLHHIYFSQYLLNQFAFCVCVCGLTAKPDSMANLRTKISVQTVTIRDYIAFSRHFSGCMERYHVVCGHFSLCSNATVLFVFALYVYHSTFFITAAYFAATFMRMHAFVSLPRTNKPNGNKHTFPPLNFLLIYHTMKNVELHAICTTSIEREYKVSFM